MFKKGAELETAGDYKNAAEFYFNALNRNRANVDALISLKRVGTKVLNSQLDQFFKDQAMDNDKKAIYTYLDAKKYQKRLASYGVVTIISNYYSDEFKKVKKSYVSDLYTQGVNYLDEENFSEAEVSFTELIKFSTNYKDAKELLNISYAEPRYIDGKRLLEQSDYRGSYNSFSQVLTRIPNYKDAKESRAEALELGIHTFVFFPFENVTSTPHVESKIASYISNNLSNLNDPFLRLVDRSNFDKIIKEQELALSGIIDESTATKIGNLLGAKTAITGKVISCTTNKTNLKGQRKEGYQSYTVKKIDPETNKSYNTTKYKKISYKEYARSVRVNIGFQYKIISLETGEILRSDIIELNTVDNVRYSTSSVSVNSLYPSSGSTVSLSRSAVRNFRSNFSSRQNLKSNAELINDLCKQVSTKVSHNIRNFLD